MSSSLLWIGSGFFATLFTVTGTLKLLVPRERLQAHMRWAASWPRWRIKLLGLAELAGAVGLVAPRATGIAPALTPIAAVCLAVLMAGAMRTHRRLGESVAPPAMVALLLVALAAALTVTRVAS